jgi:hypothetical protein
MIRARPGVNPGVAPWRAPPQLRNRHRFLLVGGGCLLLPQQTDLPYKNIPLGGPGANFKAEESGKVHCKALGHELLSLLFNRG